MVAGTSASSSSYDTPKSASLRDILLAVQLPLLCKLNHNGTPAGEGRAMLGPFASSSSSSSSDADMAELRVERDNTMIRGEYGKGMLSLGNI